MFQPNISKEEVNKLPIEDFSKKIVVVETKEQVKKAFEVLNQEKMVGIDTETKPSFKRGVIHKVALVQISTDTVCYLFRLNKIGFPNELSDFLSNENIMKIGLSLKDDLNGLRKMRKRLVPANFIDIQVIAKNYGILELSLQKIYALIFGKKISKAQRLSNWENKELTLKQQKYAAFDAWAVLKIYQKFQVSEKVSKLHRKHSIAEIKLVAQKLFI